MFLGVISKSNQGMEAKVKTIFNTSILQNQPNTAQTIKFKMTSNQILADLVLSTRTLVGLTLFCILKENIQISCHLWHAHHQKCLRCFRYKWERKEWGGGLCTFNDGSLTTVFYLTTSTNTQLKTCPQM